MEKQFKDNLFIEINQFRKDPPSVIKKLEIGRLGLSRLGVEGFIKTIDDLIWRVKSLNPLPILTLSHGLCKAAERSLDMVSKNLYSCNGNELETRLQGCVANSGKVVCLADNGS